MITGTPDYAVQLTIAHQVALPWDFMRLIRTTILLGPTRVALSMIVAESIPPGILPLFVL